ncbi:hypothetical protein [Jatrophihabitans sp.]|uniref:hypothetical protein n=1 Tax=Jatrophihabitans sp. TaxID=1932789 RepID=UPI0030C762E4
MAVTADLTARGVTTGSISVALAVASAAVRDAAGCAISEETSTVVVNAGRGNLLELPAPITAVTSVLVDGYALDADDYEVLPNGLWRHCGWGNLWDSRSFAPVPVTVTFTHGLSVVPADLVDLTCQLAIAWLNHAASGGGSTAGLTSARIDDAAETYSAEYAGQVSPVFIPDATRNWLERRFGSGVAVVETL